VQQRLRDFVHRAVAADGDDQLATVGESARGELGGVARSFGQRDLRAALAGERLDGGQGASGPAGAEIDDEAGFQGSGLDRNRTGRKGKPETRRAFVGPPLVGGRRGLCVRTSSDVRARAARRLPASGSPTMRTVALLAASFFSRPMQGVLHVLTGPTAVGKTEWALRWAERHGAEIVSCDSLLFYRGMDIGTAKPSAAERARVPHHLIDICPVTERMDVTHYVTQARTAIAGIVARGRPVLVVGGSGFYLKAFFAPVADDVEVSDSIRAEVAGMPLAAALERLRALNLAGLGSLDVANPRRVTRALERCLASGRKLAELEEEFARQPPPFAEFKVVLARLERNPVELEQRIVQRVDAMLQAGLVEEVRRLRAAGLDGNPSASRAIGYREVIAMLDGALPESALAAEIAKNTRALVKKQRTWFRTQLPGHRVLEVATLRDPDQLFT
jgi:tRNA dimethylallyltransferase